MLQYSNLISALDARDHFKNGASPKKLTNRGNFLLFGLLFLVFGLAIHIFTSCNDKDKPNTELVTTISGQVYEQDGSPFTTMCSVNLYHTPYDKNKNWWWRSVNTNSSGYYTMELRGEFGDGSTTMWANSERDSEGYLMLEKEKTVQIKKYEINTVDFVVRLAR